MSIEDKAPNMVGMTLHELTVVERAKSDKYGNARWLCRCSCGKMVVVVGNRLRSGNVKSCGHLKRDYARSMHYTHGGASSKLYKAWHAMIDRCERKNNSSFVNYGGRGIKVCPEWHDFEKFRAWATAHGYKDGLTIERVDVNKGYTPSNCIYADRATQNRNTRRNIHIFYNGDRLTISEFSRIIGYQRTSVLKWYHTDTLIDRVERFGMRGRRNENGMIEIYGLKK